MSNTRTTTRSGAVRSGCSADIERATRRTTVDTEAYQSYLQGRFQWNKHTLEGLQASIEYFQQAIAKDPDFAQAYVGMADIYIMEGGWGMEPATVALPKAEKAAQHALALDPDNADAHAALGLIAMNYDWDWAMAEQELRRALALDPSNALTYDWYAEYLMVIGRADLSLNQIEHARARAYTVGTRLKPNL